MGNDSLSLITTALDVQLARISDHHLSIIGIILAILGILVALYLGYFYVKKLNIENKKDLDHIAQAIAQSEVRIEGCIDEHMSRDNQDRQAGPFCKGLSEDIKQLQNSASNYDQGLSKVARGDFKGAEIEFSAAIDQQLPMLAKYYFQRGNSRYFQKRFKDACIDYSKAIEIDPQLAKAWSNKGTALGKQGKYDEAIKAYDRAIEIDPQLAQAWYNKGTALKNMCKYDEAVKAYDEAIKLDPKFAWPWNNKGNALRMLHRNSDAEAAYAKARELGYSRPMTQLETTV
jgi:tetratricopeptide (TPR) repeat protein